ncbi:MAG TPA: BON domain-containing protein [Rhodanobacteraceae bacterium]|nr:BON domain-containing protein [Rhodanobacteraceae bacterium]
MKTQIAAVVIASLLAGSLGTIAYANGAQQMTPQPQTTPMTSAPNGMSGGQTAQQIKQALTSHGVTSAHITVAFSNGTATLSGTVYSQQDIAKAKKAAMGVPGVNHVDTSGLHARTSASQGQG